MKLLVIVVAEKWVNGLVLPAVSRPTARRTATISCPGGWLISACAEPSYSGAGGIPTPWHCYHCAGNSATGQGAKEATAKWLGPGSKTPVCHRAAKRAAMLGVRSAQPIAASGHPILRESALPRKRPSATPMQQVVMVESRMGAVTWAIRRRSVSHPRSSNRTCRSPASGSPTGFTVRHTASKPTARGFDTVSHSPSPLDTAVSDGACL